MLFRWFCLLLCVALCHPQPTTNHCTRDDGCDRQTALIEQALAMLQTMDGRLESMDRRLTTVEQRMEKTKESEADHTNGTRCRWSKDGRRSCYKVFVQRKTWLEARAYCQALYDGADLVSIETHAEDLFLVYMTQELQNNYDHFFTSGRKDVSGAWIWLATAEPFGYTGWASGEPNNSKGNEDACAFVNNDLYKPTGDKRRHVYWNDVPNIDRHGFICEFH
ncbi:hypothetical protein NP493_53g13003 [Ridgeia piscesae]|uniref:C-type lectin domain-containing protein n=1 Tax=Ridgeia piscesae TaxID=27915 RepID=A0AAD9PBE1_RIDPI|nr:hypothetical protein NP493_53g13003 [Ridgeia piscesae]